MKYGNLFEQQPGYTRRTGFRASSWKVDHETLRIKGEDLKLFSMTQR